MKIFNFAVVRSIGMLKKKLIALGCALLCCAAAFAEGADNRVPSAPVAVSALPGTLTLENNTGKSVTFTVYSITGQAVKTVTLKSDSATVALPQGFYTVKSDEGTVKVVVK